MNTRDALTISFLVMALLIGIIANAVFLDKLTKRVEEIESNQTDILTASIALANADKMPIENLKKIVVLDTILLSGKLERVGKIEGFVYSDGSGVMGDTLIPVYIHKRSLKCY